MITTFIYTYLLRISKSTWADIGTVILFVGLTLFCVGIITLLVSLFLEEKKPTAILGLKILLGGLLLAIGGGITFCSNFSLGSMN